MLPDIVIEVEDTGADTDVFAGTEADQPKFDGYALYWGASTVNTATIELPQLGHDPGKTSLLPKRTDGIPAVSEQIPYKIPFQKGARPVVAVGGTTGTVHHILALFYKRR